MRLVVFALAFLLFALGSTQTTRPILISHPDSTRAISFESVTRQREPFTITVAVKFGPDTATRIMLFAMNLQLQPGETASDVTADAEDANRTIYPLAIEHIGPVPNQPWASSLVVRLPANLPQTGDVLVRIKYHGLESNRVRVGIGHVGDGPPDDSNSVPTPGLIGPGPPSGITATNLNATDVQTILQQAAAAANTLGKAVNIVITDREGNVLGFFPMAGAPVSTTVRSVGRSGQGLEGAVVSGRDAAIAKASTAAFFSTANDLVLGEIATNKNPIDHR